MAIKGIDVSSHQGYINWQKVKADGIKFAIIRGGYGNAKVDDYFKKNIEGCIKNDISVGIYWFSYAINTAKAKEEAELCLKTIAPYKDKIVYPVFFDFEYSSADYMRKRGITPSKTLCTTIAKAFLTEVMTAGYNVGLYTNKDFSSNYFTSELLKEYDVWIAQYTSKDTCSLDHVMWQYSEKGKVDGINSNSVDMNYCYKEYVKTTNNADASPTIKYNKEVEVLQEVLNKSYKCKLSVDGLYGPKTKAIVKKHYLKKGSKGEHVKVIQTFLKKLGYEITVDGSYGPATAKVVKEFQKKNKLTVDGYAGLATHNKLIELLK